MARCVKKELSVERAQADHPTRATTMTPTGGARGSAAATRPGARVGVTHQRGGLRSSATMLMAAGPSTITNSDGKMQNTIGSSIFTGAFCARSCAS